MYIPLYPFLTFSLSSLSFFLSPSHWYIISAASQPPTAKIVSTAPDLQPKAPAAAAQEAKDGQAEDAASEEEEEEEESESDEDDVQITIDTIQPVPIPYGRSASHQRMTIPPGGKGRPLV